MKISSSVTEVERPWTLRNQFRTLSTTGFLSKQSQQINVEVLGDLADLKLLTKLQNISITHSQNDVASTVGFPYIDELLSIHE